MRSTVLFTTLFLGALSLSPVAYAQGVPGGAAHGAAVGGNVAGPVGAVVGGVVGGAIGGVEGVLGVDRYGYAQPTYARGYAVEERTVVERPRGLRARVRRAHRVGQPRRTVRRHARYRRGY